MKWENSCLVQRLHCTLSISTSTSDLNTALKVHMPHELLWSVQSLLSPFFPYVLLLRLISFNQVKFHIPPSILEYCKFFNSVSTISI